ncbi:MAG: hypothetical protein KDJ38_10580 [Gammaproteobacteria bacterium]|nr:hypothetical protein [Gammaproteobacteria bacterium]
MNLIIPSRNKPATGSFPTAPKKVRQWISELYPVSSAESTRTLIRGLKHCNRLENSVRSRLEILEHFRPVVREIIDMSVSHYVGQNLPLSQKSYNAFLTVDTLLQEMAFGYKIIVADSMEGNGAGLGKTHDRALFLALEALDEIALRHLQVYQEIPGDIWQDCNTLFKIAEDLKISTRELGKEYGKSRVVRTIQQLFISTHLLSLAGAHSLRRGQILQLHEFITRHAEEIITLDKGADLSQGEYLFGIDLDTDAPASALQFIDAEHTRRLLTLNLDPFISTIAAEIGNTPNSVSALYESDVLTRESLFRLKKSLAVAHEREHAREYHNHKLDFMHGLKEIYAVFRYADKSDSPEASRQDPFDDDLKLELEPAAKAGQKDASTDFITHPGFASSKSDKTLWDAVAKRNVASAQQIHSERDASFSDLPQRGDWILVNKSEGGIGLIWQGDSSPQVTVGELVASRKYSSTDSDKEQWITGVVTWLRINKNQKLRCGITHLAQKVKPVLVERTKGSHNSVTTQTECLVALTLDKKPQPCIIVPAYMFHSGEVVHIRQGQKVLRFKLIEKLNSTGSFSLFSIEDSGASLTADALSKRDLGDYGLFDETAH